MAEFCTLTGPSSAVSKANNYRLELALKYPFCFLCDGVGLPWYLRFLKWSLKKANVYIYIFYLYICVCVLAISKTLGSRNGHPQIWKGPIAYRTFAQKLYMANLGGAACRKNYWSTWLQSGCCASFLIRHLRCRTLSYLRRCYWKRCFANLFFPTASMDSQLAGQNLYTATLQRALQPSGRTNPNATASFPGPYRPQPLPERMSDRMPVYLYLSISVCLAS